MKMIDKGSAKIIEKGSELYDAMLNAQSSFYESSPEHKQQLFNEYCEKFKAWEKYCTENSNKIFASVTERWYKPLGALN